MRTCPLRSASTPQGPSFQTSAEAGIENMTALHTVRSQRTHTPSHLSLPKETECGLAMLPYCLGDLTILWSNRRWSYDADHIAAKTLALWAVAWSLRISKTPIASLACKSRTGRLPTIACRGPSPRVPPLGWYNNIAMSDTIFCSRSCECALANPKELVSLSTRVLRCR